MLLALTKLYRIKLLSPRGLYYLFHSVLKGGINLMALLRFAAKSYESNIAVTDEHGDINYEDLLDQGEQLAIVLTNKYQMCKGKKVAVMCRNHASLVRSVFGISQTGADLYLLNVEMSQGQFDSFCSRHSFDLVIYDEEVEALIQESLLKNKAIVAYSHGPVSVDSMARQRRGNNEKIARAHSGKITVLTGGTTGDFKTAARKASMVNFLDPFTDLVTKLKLEGIKSVYIATPVYHGFGIAAVFMGLMLGCRLYLLPRFEKQKACELIAGNRIEAVALVPLMLQRMLAYDAGALKSLTCIISGGATLDTKLVKEATARLGNILFNLYGTSEAGVAIMATPADLEYNRRTLGKAIKGVSINLLDRHNCEVADGTTGRICIRSKWSVRPDGSTWIETGDLGYRDIAGYYYLCGKTDDMIVSGGENVYPEELERILLQHEHIKQAAVIGISDVEFGQRLKAFVVPEDECILSVDELKHWLSKRIARYQMPGEIEFMNELPYTSLGKPDKKALV
jgi:acyl-CoA synthetase (AMP-forming)/AMP-acid ligase II